MEKQPISHGVEIFDAAVAHELDAVQRVNNHFPVGVDNRQVYMSTVTLGHPVFFPVVTTQQQVVCASDVVVAEQNHKKAAPWSTGLFDCSEDMPGSVEGTCCTRVANSRHYSQLQGRGTGIDCGTFLVSLGIDACFGSRISQVLFIFWNRKSIRARYNIVSENNNDCSNSTDLHDFCASVCCSECATCQHHREFLHRGEPVPVFCGRSELAVAPAGTSMV